MGLTVGSCEWTGALRKRCLCATHSMSLFVSLSLPVCGPAAQPTDRAACQWSRWPVCPWHLIISRLFTFYLTIIELRTVLQTEKCQSPSSKSGSSSPSHREALTPGPPGPSTSCLRLVTKSASAADPLGKTQLFQLSFYPVDCSPH